MKTVKKENSPVEPFDIRPQVFVRLEDGSVSTRPLPPSEYVAHVDDYSISSLLSSGVSLEDSPIRSESSPLQSASVLDSIDVDKLNLEVSSD